MKIKISFFFIILLVLPAVYAQGFEEPNVVIPEGYKLVENVQNKSDFVSLQADVERGYVAYARDNLEGVVSDSIPLASELNKEVSIVATRGEIEPASFSLYALKDMKDIRVIVSELSGHDGIVIPAKNIEVFFVYCWYQRAGEYNEKKYKLTPELLLTGAVDIPKNKSQQFWIRLTIPEDVLPGQYKGSIDIIEAWQRRSSLRFQVSVLPFKLIQPEDVSWGVFSDFFIDKLQLRDLKLHGIDVIAGGHVWAHAPIRPLFDNAVANRPKLREGVIDKEALKTGAKIFFRDFNAAGLRGPYIAALGWVSVAIGNTLNIPAQKTNSMFPSAYTDRLKEIYGDFVNVIQNAADSEQVKLYFWPVDEPGTHPDLQEIAKNEYEILRKNGMKTFLTCDIDFTRNISSLIDLRCYHPTFLFKNEDTFNMLKKETDLANAQLWTYTGLGGIPSYYVARYRCGMLPWKARLRGLMIFAYNSYRGDPFNDFDSVERDYALVYPDVDGSKKIPTLQWEGVREGIDDYKYLCTFVQVLEKARTIKNLEFVGQIAQAEKLFQRLNKRVKLIDDYYEFDKYGFSFNEFLKFRQDISERIIALNELILKNEVR